ncbi:MAG TPA: hypothetical protein VIH83_04440, partial [Candidatus Bathyarchaeia archaeon]
CQRTRRKLIPCQPNQDKQTIVLSNILRGSQRSRHIRRILGHIAHKHVSDRHLSREQQHRKVLQQLWSHNWPRLDKVF